MEKLTQEAAKVFKRLFAEIELSHLGYTIPCNGIKENRFFIAPTDAHYLYAVWLAVDSANKLFLEARVGMALREFLTDITVEDEENLNDFRFGFYIIEDAEEHLTYKFRWLFKDECILSFPVKDVTFSEDVF